MASHEPTTHSRPGDGNLTLGSKATFLAVALLVVGVLGVLASLGVSIGGAGLKRFYHAYLVSYAFFLSLAAGGMFFLLIHYLVRAAWSVSIRRIGEAMAGVLPVMGLLAIPLLVAAWSGKGLLYNWAQPKPAHADPGGPEQVEQAVERGIDARNPNSAERAGPLDIADPDAEPLAKAEHPHAGAAPQADEAVATKNLSAVHQDHGQVPQSKPFTALTMGKVVWLNPTFWTVRIVFYFALFSGVTWWFVSRSRAQDLNGDHTITEKLSLAAGPLLLVCFVMFTFAAFDLVMSLDSDWYSTVFGIYYFTGAIDATCAAVIIIAAALQALGFLRGAPTDEHYHDLGKYLFAFTFFWGYIAFSQYMLIWYANIPETTYWLAKHGMTTNPDQIKAMNGWVLVTLALLVGRLLIPFGGLLSRHVKRNRASLIFWAVWILVFHFVDMFWVVMPEYSPNVALGLPEIAAFIGVGGVFAGTLVWRLAGAPLLPLRDPRLPESLAFHNI